VTTARCSECHTLFERGDDESWKTLCLFCFKAKRKKEGATLAKPSDRSEVRKWMNMYLNMADECSQLRAQLSALRLVPTSPVVDELRENLPRLLMCCHPDRHGNSEASNKATAWLLDVKRRLAP